MLHKKLLTILKKELSYQEEILELLARERTAIVRLNQEELDKLTVAKQALLDKAKDVEEERRMLLMDILGSTEGAKFSEVMKSCPALDVRDNLEIVGAELKSTAQSVHDLNNTNAELLKQALGLVASTLAIFRSAPGTDLPTYEAKGKLKGSSEPVLTYRRSQITRQA